MAARRFRTSLTAVESGSSAAHDLVFNAAQCRDCNRESWNKRAWKTIWRGCGQLLLISCLLIRRARVWAKTSFYISTVSRRRALTVVSCESSDASSRSGPGSRAMQDRVANHGRFVPADVSPRATDRALTPKFKLALLIFPAAFDVVVPTMPNQLA